MKKGYAALWYLGVVMAVIILAVGFLAGNWLLSMTALALGILLKKTNKYIELPAIYQELGITNGIFEGKARANEKDNQ